MVISTPHYLHAPLSIKALEAGKHVLVEKPIATRLEDADAMLAKAKQTGCKLYVAYSAQVSDQMVQLRRWIAKEMLGKVTGIRIVYTFDANFAGDFNPESPFLREAVSQCMLAFVKANAAFGGRVSVMRAQRVS